ncbi:MAG TPA: HAMP domain-containing protein [Holophagaceae bacterium]|nr:HAMP domain-containing protein [Holophagaceae bacterium]
MKSLFRTHIAFRSTALILLVMMLVGIPMLALLSARERRQESIRQQATLTQLVDTVERTAQIACFLGDTRLAEELGAGLLKNPIVGQVVIRAGDRVLVSQSRAHGITGQAPGVSRELHSPFDDKAEVGRLTLLPDEAEIQRQTSRQGRSIMVLLAIQALVLAGVTVGVVLFLVTRPISRLSRRLHRLQAETGETLRTIRGHEEDEIGRLVEDVNALIDRLLTFIHAERFLRDEVEQERAALLTAKEALERSLAEVKTLQGLLPICAWCKKIRDDEGLWTQIEQYVSSNTEARFTHGLCPDCARKEFSKYRKEGPKA